MATVTSSISEVNGRAATLIRSRTLTNREMSGGLLKILPAWIISGVVHAILCLIFLVLILTAPSVDASVMANPDEGGQIEEPTVQDLTVADEGINNTPGQLNYN